MADLVCVGGVGGKPGVLQGAWQCGVVEWWGVWGEEGRMVGRSTSVQSAGCKEEAAAERAAFLREGRGEEGREGGEEER